MEQKPLYSSASVTFQLQQPRQNEIVSVIYRLWCSPLEEQLREIHPVVLPPDCLTITQS